MNGWMITYFILIAINWGVVLAKHGEDAGKHSIFVTTFAMLLGLGLLYMGGAFSHICH